MMKLTAIIEGTTADIWSGCGEASLLHPSWYRISTRGYIRL